VKFLFKLVNLSTSYKTKWYGFEIHFIIRVTDSHWKTTQPCRSMQRSQSLVEYSSFVFWRTIVCMAQHRHTCLTACSRHQISSVVDVSALLTPRHYNLQVPSTRRATLGDRVFPVAAARAWNSLPLETPACSSLLTFRRETKSHLFRQSYGWRGAVYSDGQQTSALSCATVLNLDFCKVPP